MKPPELALRELVAQWLEKADRDCDAADDVRRLLGWVAETAVMMLLEPYLAGRA